MVSGEVETAKSRNGVQLMVGSMRESLARSLQGAKEPVIGTTRVPAGRTRAVSVKDLHSCRHTFCYLAGMQGIPLAVVQSIVGHMSPEMTAHYTAHATLEDKRRGINAMPEFFSAAEIQTHSAAALIETDAERAQILRQLEALPTEELKRLLGLAKPQSNR